LKRVDLAEADAAALSLPPRERGLKQSGKHLQLAEAAVAPPSGAWIETNHSDTKTGRTIVAPPSGAWIETTSRSNIPIRSCRRSPLGSVD